MNVFDYQWLWLGSTIAFGVFCAYSLSRMKERNNNG